MSKVTIDSLFNFRSPTFYFFNSSSIQCGDKKYKCFGDCIPISCYNAYLKLNNRVNEIKRYKYFFGCVYKDKFDFSKYKVEISFQSVYKLVGFPYDSVLYHDFIELSLFEEKIFTSPGKHLLNQFIFRYIYKIVNNKIYFFPLTTFHSDTGDFDGYFSTLGGLWNGYSDDIFNSILNFGVPLFSLDGLSEGEYKLFVGDQDFYDLALNHCLECNLEELQSFYFRYLFPSLYDVYPAYFTLKITKR